MDFAVCPDGLLFGFRSVASANRTVSTMNTTEVPNTQCGRFLSMIQPNSNGLMTPPILKPVETMPNARPAAPGGAALRTIMSREGAITQPRNAATANAAVSSNGGRVTAATINRITAFTAKQAAAT